MFQPCVVSCWIISGVTTSGPAVGTMCTNAVSVSSANLWSTSPALLEEAGCRCGYRWNPMFRRRRT
jgi:hypothetical protein